MCSADIVPVSRGAPFGEGGSFAPAPWCGEHGEATTRCRLKASDEMGSVNAASEGRRGFAGGEGIERALGRVDPQHGSHPTILPERPRDLTPRMGNGGAAETPQDVRRLTLGVDHSMMPPPMAKLC